MLLWAVPLMNQDGFLRLFAIRENHPLSPVRMSILPHLPILITEKNLRTALPEVFSIDGSYHMLQKTVFLS